jgi:integrase
MWSSAANTEMPNTRGTVQDERAADPLGVSGQLRRGARSTAHALPLRGVLALQRQREEQDQARERAGDAWQDTGLVFTSRVGTRLDAANVRRKFRHAVKAAGLDPAEWTPQELRHSFVSILSDSGVRLEDIADLCGHSGTEVTETVYRHQLRPVLLSGTVAMDRIFEATPPKPAA